MGGAGQMDRMKQEPLSARMRFMSDSPQNSDDWCRMVGMFFQKIAAQCESSLRDVVIGHIKGLALFDGGNHLRISVVSSTYPPEFETSGDFEADLLPLSINVLVYGPRGRLLNGSSATK